MLWMIPSVEHVALSWLKGLSGRLANGAEVAPEAPNGERGSYGEVVLEHRLQSALAALNAGLPLVCLEQAFCKLTRPEG